MRRPEESTNNVGPTAFSCMSRFPAFAPLRKFPTDYVEQAVTWDTRWGTYWASRQLTQIHRDIIEYILSNYLWFGSPNEVGQMFYFNAYDCMKKMGHRSPNIRWLRGKLTELMNVEIKIQSKQHGLLSFTAVVHEHGYAEGASSNPVKNRFGPKVCGRQSREWVPYSVGFSMKFLRLFNIDTVLHYSSLVPAIMSINSGLIQAVIRFFFTHSGQNICWSATNVFEQLCVFRSGNSEISERAKRMKFVELWNYEKELKQLGITLSGSGSTTRIHYSQHKMVYIVVPPRRMDSTDGVGQGARQ